MTNAHSRAEVTCIVTASNFAVADQVKVLPSEEWEDARWELFSFVLIYLFLPLNFVL